MLTLSGIRYSEGGEFQDVIHIAHPPQFPEPESPVKSWQRYNVLLIAMLCGCSMNNAGTEAAARKHFDVEFKKWMAGQENTVSTMQSRIGDLKEPISYDIRSVVSGDPDFLACQDAAKLPDDWRSWPAYKLNAAIEWKSKAGKPITDISTYTLTWNTSEKRWYVTEQH